ncbi:MAG: alanine--tRNA ligase [Oscillospiraceae bacterium]|nr:alanine--tRNA ligase [Oscillospiraceae bacterium]
MKWTGLNDLRKMYLDYFASKGHLVLPSFPLIPQGDRSILLINAGMTPMKKYFSGQETPPCNRVATCQKCIRTPDIDNVGITARHGTYFEMLGNFSFGDYFKKEAIPFAWEFFTKVLEIPEELLYVSVYEQDEEARQIWLNDVGLKEDHVVKMGKEDNFWEHGSGPCGPCTEIYFGRGEKHGCGKPDCKVGCDCDRYVEVWNVVFSEFNNDGNGNYTPLVQQNIDTGMGLERLACVMQDAENIFLVDTVKRILNKVCEISGVPYGQSEKTDISIRVITDHIRSTTFMVGDGVLPQNEGRGYVLRRLLRRAARHGRLLGITRPFLSEVCDVVIAENASAYPELVEKAGYIKKVILTEEERFAKTIDQGMELLGSLLEKLEQENGSTLSGDDAFKLYDTFGFPIDLTREIVAEKGFALDEKGFKTLMDKQKKAAKAGARNNDAFAGGGNLFDGMLEGETIFTGYDTMESDGKILAMIREGDEIERAVEGDHIQFVLDATPFYAESGGQVADTGLVVCGENVIAVEDVTKTAQGLYVHSGTVTAGSFERGNFVSAQVDKEKRLAIGRNHSSAHLLQAALRKVLGDHVHQAGSLVDADRMRFDFSHFSPMTSEEIRQVEELVNQQILSNLAISMEELPIEEAKKRGATALFGEKYGDTVRVVTMGDFSVEFCGGTHMPSTGTLGLFRILSESGVAAGVRRIEAVTGNGVLHLIDQVQQMLNEAASVVKLPNSNELVRKLVSMVAESKSQRQEIDRLEQKLVDAQFSDLFSKANDIGPVKYFASTFTGMKVDALRILGDRIKEKSPDVVAVLAAVTDGKTSVLCVCGDEAVAHGADANKIVKAITAVTGGGGGGRKDNAMAGIKDQYSLDEALVQIPDFIRSMVTQ